MPPNEPTLLPFPAARWDRACALHLLNRAGFGGAPVSVDALAALGLPAAVARMVNGPAQPVVATAPAWARPQDRTVIREQVHNAALLAAVDSNNPAALAAMLSGENMGMRGKEAKDLEKNASPDVRQAIKQVRQEQRRNQRENLMDLVAWWLGRMASAADPLGEKLTLFWHGHFATSAQKVQDPFLMWQQNDLFRRYARGPFGELTKAVSRDGAMIFWLDLQQSRAQHANENFARELMELFTLGEGHYTETDVTEAARAFTGYRMDPRTEEFRFVPRDHDATPKRLLGRQGAFQGDDVVDLLLEQPACSRFLGRKLWAFFVNDDPAPEIVEAVAAELRAARYELKPVLTKIFTSREFYSEKARGTQIKSPVQWLIQTARTLEMDLPGQPQVLVNALRQMGQVPFQPPSVKGWDGGKAWISTATLLARYNLAGALLHGRSGGPPPAPSAAPDPTRLDLAKLAPSDLRESHQALVETLGKRLFATPVAARQQETFANYLKAQPGGRVTDETVLGLMHLMMSTPQFQIC